MKYCLNWNELRTWLVLILASLFSGCSDTPCQVALSDAGCAVEEERFVFTNPLNTSVQVAMDDNGNIIALWHETSNSTYRHFARVYTPGQGWAAAVTLGTYAVNPAQVSLRMDASGTAFVLWAEKQRLVGRTYRASSGWSATYVLDTDNSVDAFRYSGVAVSMDGNGNALAAWSIYTQDSGYVIRSAQYQSGSGWGATEQIHVVGDNSVGGFLLTWSQSGDALLSYRERVPPATNWGSITYTISAIQYLASTGWQSPSIVDSSIPYEHVQFQVSSDAAGNALMLWYDGTTIWSRTYSPITGPGSTVAMASVDQFYLRFSLSMNIYGEAVSVWRENGNILTSRYSPATGWSTSDYLESTDHNSWDPLVRIDNNGNAIAFWSFESEPSGVYPRTTSAHVRRYVAGVGWGADQVISTGVDDLISHEALAINSNGDAVAVWIMANSPGDYEQFGAVDDIWTSRYTAGSTWTTAELLSH